MASDDAPPRNTGLKTNLVALGSAAVIAVYAAGLARTRAAAAAFANDVDDRRPPLPATRPRPVDAPVATADTSTHPSERAHSAPAITANAPEPTQQPSAAPRVQTPASPSIATPATKSLEPAVAAQPAPHAVAATTVPPVQSPIPAPTPAPLAAPAATPVTPPKDTTLKAPVAADTAHKAAAFKDGTFTGWGTSRHGDVQVTVMVKEGKIFFAAISECLTQYSCSWIQGLPAQVVARQNAEVDYISGATHSASAFYKATLEALSKAK